MSLSAYSSMSCRYTWNGASLTYMLLFCVFWHKIHKCTIYPVFYNIYRSCSWWCQIHYSDNIKTDHCGNQLMHAKLIRTTTKLTDFVLCYTYGLAGVPATRPLELVPAAAYNDLQFADPNLTYIYVYIHAISYHKLSICMPSSCTLHVQPQALKWL